MFSATDIASFLACPHTATLGRAESKDEIAKPFFKDAAVDLLRKLGLEHEQRYLRELAEKDGLAVAQIEVNGRWEDAVAATVRALREGVDAVYQATFLDGQWGGRSDFLVRVNKPSALGAWSYEVVETKLARSTKATALVQLCFYSDLLSRIQGVEPQWMHVVLGGAATPERFPVQRYIAYFRKVRSEFEAAWKLETDTYPEPTEHCEVCSWFPLCDTRRRADDHLSFVAGISRNQRKALAGRGVSTVAALAKLALPPKPKIERIGDAALLRIREQAHLMHGERDSSTLLWLLGLDPKAAKAADCNKIIGKAKDVQLNQLLVAALLLGSIDGHRDDSKERSALLLFAKVLGLKTATAILAAQDERISKERACRGCGCTEETPCDFWNGDKRVACSWVEQDLCSNPDCKKYAPALKVQASAKSAGK